jgi:hypothetical protein
MLLFAASHPFKRVLGVEIAPQLCEVAWQNVDRNAERLSCSDLDIAVADASMWTVPDDVTVVYFFNAFTGRVFQEAMDRLVASIERRPRRLTLISMFPRDAAVVARTNRFEEIRSTAFGAKQLERIVYYRSRTVPASS